jgi:hypothetical protein
MRLVGHAYHWLAVNGGVLAVATVVAAAERHILDVTLSKELSALGSTLACPRAASSLLFRGSGWDGGIQKFIRSCFQLNDRFIESLNCNSQ